MYIPNDRYLWDFWLIQHGGVYHLFHLEAPRGIPDPELRHGLARVGHAVSEDLVNWHEVGVALGPGKKGEWDDRAIWTGSVIEKDGQFYMLYTGTSKEEGGKIQRIGVAVSSDLTSWRKLPDNPVLEADPTWYETVSGISPFQEVAWRDPYVVKIDDAFYALITARRERGDPRWRGCIAVAKTSNFISWEVCPPLDIPAPFSQLEVPQVIRHDGRYYLLFSAVDRWVGEGVAKATGTFYAVSSSFRGPYSVPKALVGDGVGSYYGAKLVQTPQGEWVALAWLGVDARGVFVGGLSDPMPVIIQDQTIRLL